MALLWACAQARRPRQDRSSPVGGGNASAPLTIQFEANTADVRGLRAAEAAGVVDETIASAPPGSAVFVVHGVGSGRLRAEVLELLARNPQVWRPERALSVVGVGLCCAWGSRIYSCTVVFHCSICTGL